MEELTKILDLKNEIEAQLLAELLDKRQIPHVITSFHDSALDGLFQTQKGWGHLDASEEHRDAILELYESLLSDEDVP